jgi:UDPglucose--hexose-1-phosphate uridylyltransferase
MAEPATLRRALAGGTWSIVAPHRFGRPAGTASSRPAEHCHFCEGNEHETEAEVYALRRHDTAPDTPGWLVRVVPNKYPAVQIHAGQAAPVERRSGLVPARGCHEVIIETPDHRAGLAALTTPELAAVLGVYRARLRALSAWPDVRSVALFRNEGAAAGASQEHPHAQVLGLPVVPGRLARETALARRHLRQRGCCSTCEMLERESRHGARVVMESPDFLVLAAFAPRFAYETWIVPRSHGHEFAAATRRQLSAAAGVLAQVLAALRGVMGGAFPFNVVVQTAPVRAGTQTERAFHWRLEILPRLTTASGFELGSGVFIVTVSPEQAARHLRGALVSDPMCR